MLYGNVCQFIVHPPFTVANLTAQAESVAQRRIAPKTERVVHAVSCEHSSLHVDRASLQYPCNEEMTKLQTGLHFQVCITIENEQSMSVNLIEKDRCEEAEASCRIDFQPLNQKARGNSTFTLQVESRQEPSFTIRCAGFQDVAA